MALETRSSPRQVCKILLGRLPFAFARTRTNQVLESSVMFLQIAPESPYKKPGRLRKRQADHPQPRQLLRSYCSINHPSYKRTALDTAFEVEKITMLICLSCTAQPKARHIDRNLSPNAVFSLTEAANDKEGISRALTKKKFALSMDPSTASVLLHQADIVTDRIKDIFKEITVLLDIFQDMVKDAAEKNKVIQL